MNMQAPKWLVFRIVIAVALVMALNGGTVQAGNVILLNNFDSSSMNWGSYWWGLSGEVPIQYFYPVAWENMGGEGDTGYVWTDDTRWSIDYPDSSSILAFVKYQSWDGNPQLNLQNAVVSVYVRGEALDLKGAKFFFWVANHDYGVRYHYVAYPLTISQGSWETLQSFVLRNDESLWFNSWARYPSNIPNLDYVLGHVDSYGFSFRGMSHGQEVTGILMMDEFSITTQSTPTITWPNPADIVYGTALSAAQLNATASVSGTFGYTPPPGTVLNAGENQTLNVTFTPTDAANYTGAAASVHLTVTQATPTITWPNPADIVYGTALSTAQLNATASVSGTFGYTPPPGTVLNAGENQTLNVTFTPTDAANYTGAAASVHLTVTQATPTITWPNPADIVYGTALSAAQLNATASVSGTFGYTPPPGTVLNAGENQTLNVAFTPTDAANYTGAAASVHLTVTQATPTITWPNPADIVYGTALSAAQLNATASVSGTFGYTPPPGTVLNAGENQTLNVTFTPTNAINYTGAVASVHIAVYIAVHADFEANPVGGLLPLTVVFTNTSTGDYDATEWDFGDGVTSTVANPAHTYDEPGVYTVTLKASGLGGADTVTRMNLIRVYAAVKADFEASPLSGIAPLEVAFTNKTTGDWSALEWDFGDGVTSTVANPAHTYDEPGVYTVMLKASGLGGADTVTRMNLIRVYAAVKADFEASPLSGIAPLEVAFTNKTTGDWSALEWDFGDGVTSTVANPAHTYDEPGVYTVTLRARGLGGADAVIQARYVRVFRPGAGYFTATPTHGSVPMIVSFTSTIPVQYSLLEWNFGDGGVNAEISPTHTYTLPGIYDVTLLVYAPEGLYSLKVSEYIVAKSLVFMPLVVR